MKQLLTIFSLVVFVFGLAFAQEANITQSKVGEKVKYVGSPEATLYDQTGTATTTGYASQQFGDFPTYSCQLADDFVVPASEEWTIEEIIAIGQPGTLAFTSALVEFYNNSGSLPGSVVATQTATLTDVAGVLTVTLSPAVVLTSGTYWVSVSAIGDFAVYGQWYWYTSTSVNGSNMAWQNPGNGFGTGFTTWTAGATVWPGSDYDLAFQLNGTSGGGGYGFPELLYYVFDEGTGTTTANYAVPGVGNNPANLTGTTTWATPGQFGSAIIGDGATNGGIVTGWNVDLGAGSWTISMWLEIPSSTSGSAYYIFGDGGAGSFRCFHNGIALQDNLVLRGSGAGIVDFYVNGIGPAPTVVTFVYDATATTLTAYKDGVFYADALMTINLPVGTGFKTGGYGSSATMIGKMDEFRFYNRALDAAEVAATWNISIVPVELTSFTASVTGNNVELLWETATETNNSGFSIERKSDNSQYVEVGFVPGHGTTSEPKSYSFSDQNLRTGEYTYRLKQVDFDGTFAYSDEVAVDVIAPAEFSLDQNYPNPFNPSTRISFSLAVDSKVSLKVYDVIGQEVASLINQDLTAGVHNYTFNAAGINSGVYFYRIEATGVNGTEFVDVKKMILVK